MVRFYRCIIFDYISAAQKKLAEEAGASGDAPQPAAAAAPVFPEDDFESDDSSGTGSDSESDTTESQEDDVFSNGKHLRIGSLFVS